MAELKGWEASLALGSDNEKKTAAASFLVRTESCTRPVLVRMRFSSSFTSPFCEALRTPCGVVVTWISLSIVPGEDGLGRTKAGMFVRC